MERLDPD